MLKLKLMSVLQSRISKRKWFINRVVYKTASRSMKAYVKGLAILRQLILDERELKMLRECAKNLQGRIDTLLGWNK